MDCIIRKLTLACLKTTLCFVDHIYAALTTNHATIPVARFERAERVFNLHGLLLFSRRAGVRPLVLVMFIPLGMVGVTGIEPVTPSMSTKCSPAELYALIQATAFSAENRIRVLYSESVPGSRGFASDAQ